MIYIKPEDLGGTGWSAKANVIEMVGRSRSKSSLTFQAQYAGNNILSIAALDYKVRL